MSKNWTPDPVRQTLGYSLLGLTFILGLAAIFVEPHWPLVVAAIVCLLVAMGVSENPPSYLDF